MKPFRFPTLFAAMAVALFALASPGARAAEDVTNNITVPIAGGNTATMGTYYVDSRHIAHNTLFSPAGVNAFGSAGTPAAPVLSVQGITSGTPLFVTLSGTNNIGTVSTVTTVTTLTGTTSLTPGTGATNLGKAEDSPHASGDVGVMALCVRSDSATATGADGDYVPCLTNNSGKLWTTSELPAGSIASGAFSSGSIGSGAIASGAIASGAVASGAFVSGSVTDGAIVALGTRADAAWTSGSGTVVSVLKSISNGITSSIITTGTDAAPSSATVLPVHVRPHAPILTKASVSFSASGDNTVITRTTGTIKVYRLMMACDSEVAVTYKNGSTGLSGVMKTKDVYLPFENGEPHFTTTSTNNFVINLGSSVQCSGTIAYLDN